MKNLRIKAKLSGGFAALIVMMLIVSVVCIVALQRADEELSNYAAGSAVAKQEVARMGLYANTGARAIRNMYIYALDDMSTIANYENLFNENMDSLNSSMAKVRATGAVDETSLTKYESTLNSWLAYEEQVISHIKNNDFVSAKSVLENYCAPGLASASEGRGSIASALDILDAEILAASVKSNATATYTAIGMLLISVLAGVLLSLKIVKDILTPVEAIGKSMDALSNGDLKYENDFYGGDEFGELCDTVRSTTVELSSYINEIDRAMKELSDGNFNIQAEVEFRGDFKGIQVSILDFVGTMNSTLSQIATVSDQVSVGSNQVAVGAQTLAQGSTEQASTVEELSDAINSVTQEIQANSENASDASKIATDMGREIEVSNKQMQSTVNAMQEINSKSNEMIKIVKIIDDIAFQTNILALNAAVEAARAGVAGKGFAVVADEVRNLASKSSEAAKNITVLIGDSIESINMGNDVATKAADALEGVVKNAEEVILKIDDIASASRVQSEATEKINEGIVQISSVVQSISATSEESAAASEELASQSTALNSLLSNFDLGSSNGGSKVRKAKVAPQAMNDDFGNDNYDDYNDKY